MVYLEKPATFNPQFTAVGCFITYGDEILLLLRQDHKPQGNTWGVPGGKIESGETVEQAAKRELFEETGLRYDQPMRLLKPTYVSYNGYEFIYLMYALDLPEKPLITIDETSHKEFRWVKIHEVNSLPGIPGLDEHMSLLLDQTKLT